MPPLSVFVLISANAFPEHRLIVSFQIISQRKPTDSRAVAKPRWAPVRAAMRMFDGAKQDRLSGDWLTHPVTAEWLIRMHQRVLVARSREQAVNNDYAKAFVRM